MAPATGREIIKALAATIAGVFQSPSDLAQRGLLAILHELVHYQQDLSTGLGAWDHLTTREAYPRLVHQAKWFVTRYTPPPYAAHVEREITDAASSPFIDQVRGDLSDIHESTIGLRLLRNRTWWNDQTIELLGEFGISATVDDLSDFSLRSMFEGEAAALVWDTLRRAKYDEDSSSWLDEHRRLWHLEDLDDDYVRPLIHVATAINNGAVTDEILTKLMPVLTCLVAFMVDWASAYPPPSMVSDRRTALVNNPVLRFMLGLRAVIVMTDDAAREMFDAILDFKWNEAEQTLANWTAVRYPSSALVYQRWIETLAPLAASGDADARLFEARVLAMRGRENGSMSKGVLAIATAGSPVQVLVEGAGLHGVVQGEQLLHTGEVLTAFLVRQEESGSSAGSTRAGPFAAHGDERMYATRSRTPVSADCT